MFKKSRRILLIGGVLAAVSFGGSALAAAGAAPVQPTHVAVTTQKAGDTETADGAQFGNNEADEESSDEADGESESDSEMAGNDGPGGHHDEPGNPDAQHEASGQSE